MHVEAPENLFIRVLKGVTKMQFLIQIKKKAFFQLILNVNVILYVEFIRKSILAKSRIEKNIIGISQ